MDATDLHFISLAKEFGRIAVQVALAYNKEQEKLELASLLSLERLSTAQGIELSLTTIGKLGQLTLTHKLTFGKFMISAATELASAIEKMPSGLQERRAQQFLSTIQRQLETQAGFYT